MARRAKSGTAADGTGNESGDVVEPGIDPSTTEAGIDELERDGSGLGESRTKRKYSRSGSTERAPRKSAAQKALDLSGISSTLYGIHAMLAVMVKAPELAITETEAATLASAISNVQRHYDMGASQKTMDWVNLATCVAVVYGPRIFSIASRKPTRAPVAQAPAKPVSGFNAFVNHATGG